MTTGFSCRVCPFDCQVDREVKLGVCRAPNELMIARTQLHFDEEPFISGTAKEGSGTVFFSRCNLSCVFCQNYLISQEGMGKAFSIADFVGRCKDMASEGALNINLVSPTPYSHLLVPALTALKKKIRIPVVWNSNGYETVGTIRSLEGLVDVYLPDMKYFSDVLAKRYSLAPGYFAIATKAIEEMRRQQPDNSFDPSGILQKGVAVRHLMLPGCPADSLEVLKWIDENLGNHTQISLMAQYFPTWRASEHPEIDRHLTAEEYQAGVDFLNEHGFDNALVQDLTSADSRYTPEF
ncbi:hypothetical protein AUK40_02415 [Candidatus Wirthbacteria bacterium CG2_30_54_11]|uniref:Radical SAM core domain-containing protein n=1 Tax=Candidatus Wirthbacteria bacterium CG2_30_54_11 TaxID=1817892 RepID=A0A1J5IL19_9BACT|nr:MAG: hypothetical protein AUK40_02415 [Candidatus Wirthbacteria bacterium CG2_30_54_11]